MDQYDIQKRPTLGEAREDSPRPSSSEGHTVTIAVPHNTHSWSYQCLLDRRIRGDRLEYLVQWTPTWEDADSIAELEQAVVDYEKMQRLLDDNLYDTEDCDCSLCSNASDGSEEYETDSRFVIITWPDSVLTIAATLM